MHTVALLCLICAGITLVTSQDEETGDRVPHRTSPADQEALVDAHNNYRRILGASNMMKMSWNDELAELAQHLADSCVYEHKNRKLSDELQAKYESTFSNSLEKAGQNLRYVSFSGDEAFDSVANLASWYNEVEDYNHRNGECIGGKVCQHYKQMMRGNTYEVGCAVGVCRADSSEFRYDSYYFVCNYGPNNYAKPPYLVGDSCSECLDGAQCDGGLCVLQQGGPSPGEPSTSGPSSGGPSTSGPSSGGPSTSGPSPGGPSPGGPSSGGPSPAPSTALQLPLQLSFEDADLSNMIQFTDDNGDWSQHSGSTPSSNTGPSGAFDGTSYIYIEASDFGRREFARISTLPIDYTGVICMSFAYHMYGSGTGYLRVGTSSNQNLLNQDGVNNDEWMEVEYETDIRNGDQIYFEASRGSSSRSDIAVDDLRVREGSCREDLQALQLPLQLSFEDADLSNMIQFTDDNGDWTQLSGSSLSSSTGPSGALEGTSYIYIEASDFGNGDFARISTLPIDYTGVICMSFAYHMYGSGTGYLRVGTSSNQNLLNQDGVNNDEWVEVEYETDIRNGDQIYFEASRGSSSRSDIAVDDLRVREGSCREDLQGSGFSCDGEQDTLTSESCNLIQAQDDQLEWIRGSGRTPSGVRSRRTGGPVTGPRAANQGIFYLYIEATDTELGDVARLILRDDRYQNEDNMCMTFSYNMNGHHTGSLKIVGSDRLTLWEQIGDKFNDWHMAAVDLSRNDIAELSIEATSKGIFSGDIAIDNLELRLGTCTNLPRDVLMRCNFETSEGASSMCGMIQRDDDDFDWVLRNGATPSEYTGPSEGDDGSEYYIHIEASKPRTKDDEAEVCFRPTLDGTETCISFAYSMYGHHINTLSLVVDGEPKWTTSKQHGQGWIQHSLTVDDIYDKEICFVGSVGLEYQGDIALDSIVVTKDGCL